MKALLKSELPPHLAHRPSSGLFFPSLDGIRAIAIIVVIIHHCVYLPSGKGVSGLVMGIFQSGRLGVAIFFVLSGFLMGLIVFRPVQKFDWPGYIARRLGKIYPPFILSLIVSALLWVSYKGSDGVINSALLYLTTAANWLPVTAGFNDVYWSLLVEIHFYLILPISYFLIRRISSNPKLWTCVFLWTVPVMLRTTFYLSAPQHLHGWDGFTDSFPRRLDAFVLGLAFSGVFSKYSGSTALAEVAPKLTFVGAFLGLVTFLGYGLTFFIPHLVEMHCEALFLELAYVLMEISTFLVLFVVFAPNSGFSILLSNRHLGFLGVVSYEWYLFHFPLAKWARHALLANSGTYFSYFVKFGISVIGSLVLAAGVYYLFSAPILSWLKLRLSQR